MAKYDWFKEWPSENDDETKPEPGTNEYYWEGAFGYGILLSFFAVLMGVTGLVWIVYELATYLLQ